MGWFLHMFIMVDYAKIRVALQVVTIYLYLYERGIFYMGHQTTWFEKRLMGVLILKTYLLKLEQDKSDL